MKGVECYRVLGGIREVERLLFIPINLIILYNDFSCGCTTNIGERLVF